jgi:hypothetical protein
MELREQQQLEQQRLQQRQQQRQEALEQQRVPNRMVGSQAQLASTAATVTATAIVMGGAGGGNPGVLDAALRIAQINQQRIIDAESEALDEAEAALEMEFAATLYREDNLSTLSQSQGAASEAVEGMEVTRLSQNDTTSSPMEGVNTHIYPQPTPPRDAVNAPARVAR